MRSKDGKSPPIVVNSHSLTVKNTGRLSATNVRVSHVVDAGFSVFPPLPYQTREVPDGGFEVLFPKLPPGDAVTLSYIYAPPLTWQEFQTGVRSDEQVGRAVSVLPANKPPRWIFASAVGLQIVGAVTLLYWFWAVFARSSG